MMWNTFVVKRFSAAAYLMDKVTLDVTCRLPVWFSSLMLEKVFALGFVRLCIWWCILFLLSKMSFPVLASDDPDGSPNP